MMLIYIVLTCVMQFSKGYAIDWIGTVYVWLLSIQGSICFAFRIRVVVYYWFNRSDYQDIIPYYIDCIKNYMAC